MADDKVSVIEGEVIQQGATSRPIDMESLMAMAVTKGGIETLEKLMTMRRELKAEYAKEQYYISLAKFQNEISTIPKTKPVKNSNGKVLYMYAPLDVIVLHVKDALEKNGFSYDIGTKQTEKNVTAITYAHHRFGHTVSTGFTVTLATGGIISAAQQEGSALTYAKRYSFCNAFGILSGDEDTDHAENITEEPAKKEETKTEQPKATSEIPTTITVKVTGIKDNAWLKTKDDNGKEVLSHNQIAVEKNSYGIEEIGVPKARTDKSCLAGSICKFENITSKVSAKNGKTYYNATEVNTIL